MKKSIIPICIATSLLLCFCKKKTVTDEDVIKESFDKQELVNNYADNLILPNYNSFSLSLDSFINSYNSFKVSGSLSDFSLVKQKFNSAYLKYQYISLFEFGPAEQELVRINFNVFPTDSVQIKVNIVTGVYNLSAASNVDAKGFPAIDYLLFDVNRTESQIINSFASSGTKKQYVTDLLAEMRSKTSAILASWNSSYKNQFTSSLSTDIGSSIGFLINQLNYELDYLKNSKIGIPLGKKSLDIALPEKCEVYHSKKSIEYLLATLTSIENTYLGRNSAGIDGKGFDDYLDHLDAKYNGGSLNSAIKNQFTTARTKFNAITGNLDAQVISNPVLVNVAYTELVKLLVLLKTDLPSNLGVVITYQDGDGD